MIKIPIEIGDIVRVGRFKNKRVKVKTIEYDEYGLPLINGRPLLTMRIEKLIQEPTQENMIELQDILNELGTLQEKLPADLQKKVGNVFLGGNWKIAKAQGIKRIPPDGVVEPNTKWESDLFDKIDSWTMSSSVTLAKYFRKNKGLLDQLAKEFPEVLQPPIGQIAYRGTAIKIDSLEQAFRKKKFTIVKIKGREVFHFKNLDYSPNRTAQSWTIDPKVAFRFDGKVGDDRTVQVVYATKVNKDFIFNPKLMNIIFSESREEDEIVRVAEKGTFEAFVDTEIIFNTWRLAPKDNFIHRLPSAKPLFAPMIEKYNKIAKAENKRFGEELHQPAATVEDIIQLEGEEYGTPPEFIFDREYSKYVKKYINSMKK